MNRRRDRQILYRAKQRRDQSILLLLVGGGGFPGAEEPAFGFWAAGSVDEG